MMEHQRKCLYWHTLLSSSMSQSISPSVAPSVPLPHIHLSNNDVAFLLHPTRHMLKTRENTPKLEKCRKLARKTIAQTWEMPKPGMQDHCPNLGKAETWHARSLSPLLSS